MSKAPIQAFADRLSAVFVPTVLALGAAVFLGWYIAGRQLLVCVLGGGWGVGGEGEEGNQGEGEWSSCVYALLH